MTGEVRMTEPVTLEMSERVVNDVVILKLSGQLVLKTRETFRLKIDQLLAAGKPRIVVNLGDVQFIDSSGIQSLTYAFVQCSKRGEALKLVAVTRRARDVLQLTHLDRLAGVFDDEALALSSFEPELYCKCPSCENLSSPPRLEKVLGFWSEQTCPTCDAKFTIQDVQGHIIIERFRVQTYEQEYFEIVSGKPYIVRVVGRLNLFSSAALDKTWRAIPLPRRVIFDLALATDIDGPGARALLTFLGKKESSAKAAVSLEGLKETLSSSFLGASDVYPEKRGALAALGTVGDTPAWRGQTVAPPVLSTRKTS